MSRKPNINSNHQRNNHSGHGATDSLLDNTPWLFSAAQPIQAKSTLPALALARAGGPGGSLYVYSDDSSLALGVAQGQCSSLAIGARRYRHGNSKDQNYNSSKDSVTAFISHLPQTLPTDSYITPPSSVSPSHSGVRIPPPHHRLHQSYSTPHSLPLTPTSPPGFDGHDSRLDLSRSISSQSLEPGHAACAPVLPLITSVFPYHASRVAAASHMLEIVTPPDQVLKGFITDDAQLGRVVFVHLPPTHASAPPPASHLPPHFSDVLRPHDPYRLHPVPSLTRSATSAQALDIRESLTALLDLAGECLAASHLILVLDKGEREPAGLAELLHALMFVGGQPIRPGAPVGEWEWNARQWVLVSLEL